jgi:EAL domain-containing protein (putative c-di-GMP-specific phosphodiesterase class I)
VLARTIIDLGRRLGLELTTEGVERPEQLDIVARSPGIFVQG